MRCVGIVPIKFIVSNIRLYNLEECLLNMTEKPTDKVNYILDAHRYRESSQKKIQPPILKSSRENHISPKALRTD